MASATAAALGLVVLGVGPAQAADASGGRQCSTVVRINSLTYGSGSSVIHWWPDAGGGSVTWYTPGSHSNLTGLYSVGWHVTTSYTTLSSASADCSGVH